MIPLFFDAFAIDDPIRPRPIINICLTESLTREPLQVFEENNYSHPLFLL